MLQEHVPGIIKLKNLVDIYKATTNYTFVFGIPVALLGTYLPCGKSTNLQNHPFAKARTLY